MTSLFNGMSISVSAADRLKLMRLPGVKAMYPVDIIEAPTPELVSGGAAADLAAAINMTGANVAQNQLGLTGKGVKVGVIDTGIDIDHPAFGGSGVNGTTPFPTARVVAGYDFVGDAYNASGATPAQPVPVPDPIPDDCAGHGSHVAGIVGANGGGLKGVAPAVSIGAYRCSARRSSSSDVIVTALERAYADGMQIINQSLGAARQWPQYPTAQASTRLVNKGVIMITSTGNNGPGGSTPDALFAAGAPGTGAKVIGYGVVRQHAVDAARVLGRRHSCSATTARPPRRRRRRAAACPCPRPARRTTRRRRLHGRPVPGFPAGAIALIRRGTCSFNIKSVQRAERGRHRRCALQQRHRTRRASRWSGPPT